MGFLQGMFHALVALYAVTSSVLAVPLNSENKAGVLPRADAISERPVNTVNLVNRADLNKRVNFPTVQDVHSWLLQNDRYGYNARSMVFWSGTDEQPARDWAASHGRNTMEMLIKKKWPECRYFGPNLPLKNFEDTKPFWNTAAKAAAEFAQGDVWVLLTGESDKDQTRRACEKCWKQVEKPTLLSRWPRDVNSITKFRYPTGENVGLIESLSDKT